MKTSTGKCLCMAAAALLLGGCATERYVTDARHPEVAITEDGRVTYRGERVDPEDLPGLLKDSGLRKEDTINILCAETMTDWRLQRKVMAILSRNGFTRPVLVSERKAYSEIAPSAEDRRRERARRQRESSRVPERGPDGRIKVRYKN